MTKTYYATCNTCGEPLGTIFYFYFLLSKKVKTLTTGTDFKPDFYCIILHIK